MPHNFRKVQVLFQLCRQKIDLVTLIFSLTEEEERTRLKPQQEKRINHLNRFKDKIRKAKYRNSI